MARHGARTRIHLARLRRPSSPIENVTSPSSTKKASSSRWCTCRGTSPSGVVMISATVYKTAGVLLTGGLQERGLPHPRESFSTVGFRARTPAPSPRSRSHVHHSCSSASGGALALEHTRRRSGHGGRGCTGHRNRAPSERPERREVEERAYELDLRRLRALVPFAASRTNASTVDALVGLPLLDRREAHAPPGRCRGAHRRARRSRKALPRSIRAVPGGEPQVPDDERRILGGRWDGAVAIKSSPQAGTSSSSDGKWLYTVVTRDVRPLGDVSPARPEDASFSVWSWIVAARMRCRDSSRAFDRFDMS